MAWKTIEIEIDEKPYTATEPRCRAYDKLVDRETRGSLEEERTAQAEFVLSCLKSRYPDLTADMIKDGTSPRTLGAAVTALLELGGLEKPKPGELGSA